MKKSHFHYEMLNYSVCDDYIVYPSLNHEIKSRFPMQNIGIFILEINNWKKSIEFINELYRYSLIDSFSVQIDIKKNFHLYLLLKIVALGATELKFRYYNLKNHLEKKHSSSSFLSNRQLETVYVSMISPRAKDNLDESEVFRHKRNYFYSITENKKIFFFLYNLNVISSTQNISRLKMIAELLQASDIRCSLILYSKNLGDCAQSNYYIFAMHSNYRCFENHIQEKLTQAKVFQEIKNIFHPFFLGRILTRGPIDSKYLQNTSLPPIFNTNLQFKTKINEKYVPNSIDWIVKGIPHEQTSEGFYKLYDGEVILFIVKKLNLVSIRLISRNLTKSFQKCIIYFENERDYQIFKKKIEKSNNIQKTIVCSQLLELQDVLKKLKNRYNEQTSSAS